nr:TDP-N-acetylfucosamine:lipid II N-acetylfucosaminyltransferase [Photobacterium sanctipauli]
MDALVKLTGSNLQRDIIMPMSYGSKSYCEVVKKYISDNNLSNINLVEEFLEYDEYIELISSCDTVFMNHIRQQALGNIIFNIYIGMRVFLREECPTYEFLTKNKIKVFSINKFELEPDEFYKVLSDEDKLKNRINILKVWGVEIIDNKTKNFIEKIL